MLTITPGQLDRIIQTIKSLIIISISLLIVFILLKLLLNFFQKRNASENQQRDLVVEGQVGYVFKYVHPEKPGYVVCETQKGIQFTKAEADIEIEEGTAVVVISCQKDICKIKPLVSRVNPS
ncbi:MAG: hypothetical protein GX145_01770 [Clostridiaceae bacterium]|jgi:membrane protein implicated in regulation of membrane protease activity|nr:hypothetical protein [Bacillota bacterium]NLN51528.1 hypothetical protein [Clostridiaceae bacterium]